MEAVSAHVAGVKLRRGIVAECNLIKTSTSPNSIDEIQHQSLGTENFDGIES